MVSHEEIDEHLWPDTFVDAGSIHSLISQIRDALGDDGQRVAEPVVLSSGERIVVGTVSVVFRLLPELRTTEDVRD